MNKVEITQNFVMPTFQTVNKNQQSTQLILMDSQNGSLYLLHQYFCLDNNDYKQLITLLQTQAALGKDSPYVLNPVVYLPIKFTNQLSQTSHFIQVLYEYGSHTLEQQLYLRVHQQRNYFEEHQIWSILGSCVLGLKYLKDNDFNHSSICMNDIFVTKQGQIKLCHPMFRTYDHAYSSSLEQNYYQRAIGQNYYFSPQQLPKQKVLNRSRLSSQLNVSKTHDQFFQQDIFSLGMVMVSVCYLGPLNSLYVRKGTKSKYSIVFQGYLLEQIFYSLQKNYSQSLLDLLFRMLTYNSEQRMTVDSLSEIIGGMIESKYAQQMNEQMAQVSFDSKGMIKFNQQKQFLQLSEQKNYGKFSRISQATQISGNGTQRNENKRRVHELQIQDKPSPVSLQCSKDYQNIDINEQQSQRMQQSQSFDKTLKQYINNQQSSLVQQVNRTTLCQQYQNNAKNNNVFSPQQVVSIVMTSKQSSSLPDDSTSIVVQKRVINRLQNSIQRINMQNNMNINHNNNLPQTNGFKLYLLGLKEQNKQEIFKHHQNHNDQNNGPNKNYIASARTYHQFNKQNHFMHHGFQVPIRVNQNKKILTQQTYVLKQNINMMNKQKNVSNFQNQMIKQPNNMIKKPQINNFLTISLNKDYQKLLQNQTKNPNNLFTDPSFLNAIRQDVNKILKKRKITVTMGENSPRNSELISNGIIKKNIPISIGGNSPRNSITNNKNINLNGQRVTVQKKELHELVTHPVMSLKLR